ncbi:hypothetical protein Plhal304r1_c017g0061581 [Plasmopara halstedii]
MKAFATVCTINNPSLQSMHSQPNPDAPRFTINQPLNFVFYCFIVTFASVTYLRCVTIKKDVSKDSLQHMPIATSKIKK